MAEDKVFCPQCGSDATVEISSQRHCQQCAHDFDFRKHDVPKVERSFHATGYVPPAPFVGSLIAPKPVAEFVQPTKGKK
jgi:hypothetical protein